MSGSILLKEEVFTAISNKMKYGAPEIRGLYQKFLTKGLLLAILIHSIFISGYLLSVSLNVKAENEIDKIIPKYFDFKELQQSQPIKDIPNENIKSIVLKDRSSLIPEPVKRTEVREQIKIKTQAELESVKLPVSSNGTEDISNLNIIEGNTASLDNIKVDNNILKDVPVKIDYREYEVDKAPVAVNINSVKSSLVYPENAAELGIEGKVVANILVGKDGSVIKVGKITGPEVFSDEVSEKIMDLKFTTALKNNEPVNCWVNVPFNFVLKSKIKKNDDGDNN